jgi:drug/metabolite transporter (DMT)-like permease
MNTIFNYWEFWVLVYLVSAVIFAQTFKRANREMRDASLLTILLELWTAFFSLFFIFLFKIEFPSDYKIYITLGIVIIIYAITDRLNTEVRYGLDPSTFSMFKQLSTVFMIFFGFIFLREPLILHKVIGSLSIVLANVILTIDNKRIKINKYIIMSIISNFLFAVAMLINVDIASHFNLAIYTFFTVFFPALLIFIHGRYKISNLKKEWSLYPKNKFILSGFTWSLMLISSVRAYQLGSVSVVASLFALTSILNALVEFIINKNRKKLLQKIIASILILIGVMLVKM